jgi:hypothetical protein
MSKVAIAALFVISAIGGLAGPASAGNPAGSAETCTSSFEAMTLPAILAQAERNGIPEDRAREMFDSVNKNDDAWICQKKMPSPLSNHYNFVDNQAVGTDRS